MHHFTEQEKRAVIAELDDKNDRTCAIVGLSILEPLIEKMLFRKLREVSGKAPGNTGYAAVFEGLVGIGKKLDGFVSQCTLLYLLGAIADWAFSDLKLLAKIRNQFAHNAVLEDGEPSVTSKPGFASGKIAAWCKGLQAPNLDVNGLTIETHFTRDNPRHRFVWTVLSFANAFAYLADESSSDTTSETAGNSASLTSSDSSGQMPLGDSGT